MRDEVLRLLEDQGKSTQSIHDLIMQKFDSTRDQIGALEKNVTELAGAARKQVSTVSERQQKASASLRRGQRDLNKNIDRQFSKLSISSAQQEFLDSLYFSEMFARQENMKKNLPGTYDWVFDDKMPSPDWSDCQSDVELRGRIK